MTYCDRCGEFRRDWRLRLWAPQHFFTRWWWKNLIGPLLQTYYCTGASIGCSSITHITSDCYCPLGLKSAVWASWNGFGFRLWVSRNRMPEPCICTLSLLEGLPDYDPEKLEELGGMARVKELLDKRMAMVERLYPRMKRHGVAAE